MADGVSWRADEATRDHGLGFDFSGKKEDDEKKYCNEEVIVSEVDKNDEVYDNKEIGEEEGKKHRGSVKTLQPSSNSSSDKEEEGEGGEKKGLLDKIKEKINGGKKMEEEVESPPPTPAAGPQFPEAAGDEEKKGLLGKIKEKIPVLHFNEEEEREKGKSECH